MQTITATSDRDATNARTPRPGTKPVPRTGDGRWLATRRYVRDYTIGQRGEVTMGRCASIQAH